MLFKIIVYEINNQLVVASVALDSVRREPQKEGVMMEASSSDAFRDPQIYKVYLSTRTSKHNCGFLALY